MDASSRDEHNQMTRGLAPGESHFVSGNENVNSLRGVENASASSAARGATARELWDLGDAASPVSLARQPRPPRRGSGARRARHRESPAPCAEVAAEVAGVPLPRPLLEVNPAAGALGTRLGEQRSSLLAFGPLSARGRGGSPLQREQLLRGARESTPIWLMPPISIFLVDDSPSFLQSAARFLASDERIEIVGVALSAEEALDQVARLRPDLVLMDLNMPGMNGLEATRLLKSGPNPPRVVILTLNDTQEYRQAALQAQADAFVAKSDFGQKLLPLLESFLRSSSSESSSSEPSARPGTEPEAQPGAEASASISSSSSAPVAPLDSLDASSVSETSTSAAVPILATSPRASRARSEVATGAVASIQGEVSGLAVAQLVPLVPQAARSQRRSLIGASEAAVGSVRMRVLLAEDQTSVSHLMAVNMWRAGIETRIAPDAISVLELVESFEPHLVLLNAASPHMKASTVCRSIRDRSDVPILFVATREAAARGCWCMASTPGLAALQGMANVEELFACAEDLSSLTSRVQALLSRFYSDA